jgi:hypothetical protein
MSKGTNPHLWTPEDDARLERDARLYAAGPELLSALTEALGYIVHLHQTAYGRALPSNNSVGKQIRKAIAKAEGRSHD